MAGVPPSTCAVRGLLHPTLLYLVPYTVYYYSIIILTASEFERPTKIILLLDNSYRYSYGGGLENRPLGEFPGIQKGVTKQRQSVFILPTPTD